jgi:superfamily II DNA or RNA helicase
MTTMIQQLKIAQERQVLFATYEMVNEGFDLPKLNTLVMATPRSKIEQAVGRILRARSEAAPPLIVDVVDALPVFKNQSAKRNTWYRGRGYKIITMGS